MNKERKKGLVPALRFPEFRDTIGWKNEPLDKIYSFKVTNSLSRDRLNYENGTVKNIHYGDIHTKFAALFDIEKELVPFINPTEPLGKIKKDCYCKEGDMVFADASEDLNDVGKSIEIVNINNKKLVSGLHTLLARQQGEKLIVGFGGYLFKSNRIREQFKKESQGAKVLGISARRMSKIDIAFPADKKEQQKIADCLSSLDELIAAHTKKHEALQSYKKGLMQNIFPAEDETVPALRFPEFENVGEWEEKEVGDVFDVTRGYVLSMELVHAESTEANPYPVYSSQTKNNGLAGYYSEHLYENALTWTTDGANAGDVNYRDGKFYCTNVCGVLLNDKGYANPCIAAILDSVARNHVSYVGNPKLMNGIMSKIVIPFPSLKEQQKIADCLSSLDELIATQAQKIEDLKAHKKGLMQQLFPAMDEVAA